METEKTVRKRSVRSISLAILFALVLPLVIFLGVGSVRQFLSLQEQERQQSFQQFQMSIHEVETELLKADSFMTALLVEFAPLKELQFELDELSVYRNKQMLYTTFGSFLSQNEQALYLAVYIPQTDCYLFRDNDRGEMKVERRLALRKDVSDSLRSLANTADGKELEWYTLNSGEEVLLCKPVSIDDTWVICCFSLKKLAEMAEQYTHGRFIVSVWDGDNCLACTQTPPIDSIDSIPQDRMEAVQHHSLLLGRNDMLGLSWIGCQEYSRTFSRGAAYAALQMGITVTGMVALLAAFFVWRRSFLEPLEALKQTMKQIQDGKLETQALEAHAGEEMHEINTAFNGMMQSIRCLKIESYEKELKSRQAKLDFYKAQIRPHFYLNCLKNIYSLAKNNETDKIGKSILLLADYLRYTFQQDVTLVEISEELERCREYVRLFGLSASFPPELTITIDPEIEHTMLPPLSILTLLENALKHMPSGQRTVHIDICAKQIRMEDRTFLHIVVRDDGEGFPPEVEKYLNEQDWDTYTGKQVGLKNVIQRLYLIYGKENVFTGFYSDNGAIVELFFPTEVPEQEEMTV